ncbi:MAG: cyclic nucleotide-binding domain-containing protein [Pseudohongiellaceae bacterium]
MGLVYAAGILLALLAGTDFIGRIPTFVLGGLLIFVGLDFLYEWLWKARRELPTADYLIIVLILAVIAVADILEGVAFGFAVATVLFVINYSKLSVIKNETNGRDHASNVDRDLQTRERLNQAGERILILALQGFIFFGTADRLMARIRDRIQAADALKLDFLVLDFHHLGQLDSSAVKTFSKLSQLSDKHGFHIIITAVDNAIAERFEAVGFMTEKSSGHRHLRFEQLDDGVAWCEEQLLFELALGDLGIDSNLVSMLASMTESEEYARALAPYFKDERHYADAYLFHQNEAGDSLYLIGSGSAAVVIEINGTQRILRHYKAGAVLGEMALYTGEPRSASVIIEEDAVLYKLTAAQHAAVQSEHPLASGRMHAYIVRLLSERLSRANRELKRYL